MQRSKLAPSEWDRVATFDGSVDNYTICNHAAEALMVVWPMDTYRCEPVKRFFFE